MRVSALLLVLVGCATALRINNMQAATMHSGERQNQIMYAGSLVKILDASLAQTVPVIGMPSTLPYNLKVGTNRSTYSQWGQDTVLFPFLSKIQNGFFVESGAYDGEYMSNTLLFEQLGWKGLLVEPHPPTFVELLSKHRRAHTFQGCLSPTAEPMVLQFSGGSGVGHVVKDGEFNVNAQPLHALMDQMGQKTVDFWSLDIEGSEAEVLGATDFKKVEVGVLLVEMNKSEKNNEAITAVMTKEGFVDIGTTKYDGGVLDHIFVNPKYFASRNMEVPTRV